ncbi:MAG: LysE family translocator, partial [Pseudomonadota bacterium]
GGGGAGAKATADAGGDGVENAAAFGCTLGILPAIFAALLGLSAILHTGAIAYTLLKYAGAAYLLYLAWQTWNNRGPISLSRDVPLNPFQIARTGMLINVLNPKLSVFFLAFLPQFVDPASTQVTAQMILLSAIFMGLTFAVFLVYGALATAAGQGLRRPSITAWIRRIAAGAFAGLGLRLATADP